MTNRKTKAVSSQQEALGFMRSLSQQEAAQLIGKPASWLRDKSDIGCRNPDRTYDGPALVKAVMARNDLIDLTDPELRRRRQEAEVEHLEARARQAQLNLLDAESKHMPVEDVRFIMETICVAYDESFTALPKAIKPKPSEAKSSTIMATFENDIRQALHGLSETLQRRLFPADAQT